MIWRKHMCTAISYVTKDHYFGRNLDMEFSYDETVTITPRNYPFFFAEGTEMRRHYAMIGVAYVVGGYPLYYDAVNEKGLCMAALSFPHEAAIPIKIPRMVRADRPFLPQIDFQAIFTACCKFIANPPPVPGLPRSFRPADGRCGAPWRRCRCHG